MKENHRKVHKRRPAPAAGRILAVDPGARYMGIAIFQGQELIRADVENVRTPRTPAKVAKRTAAIVGRWMRRYGPEVIAVERTHYAQSRKSRRLERIVQAIAALARRQKVTVRFYLPTTARRTVCRQGRPTRLAVARILATEHYPWLYPYYEKETRRSWWRQRYWTTMFDAIAVGLAYAEDLGPRAASRKAA